MISLEDYGYTDFYRDEEQEHPGFLPARVVEVQRGLYRVVSARGETEAALKSSVYLAESGGELFPTVGDFVLLEDRPGGGGRIVKTLRRRSFFLRRDPDPGRGAQAVAANFDTVLILMSLNQNFNLRRLERYLTAAWQSGGTPAVLLTKADLPPDCASQLSAAEQAAPGVPVLAVSAVTGQGLAQAAAFLTAGKTGVFLGSSGVGKSSLANALAGEERMEVGGIRMEDARGRHTTTHRQLIRLPGGGMIIDTPGMRSLGIWDAPEGLDTAFSDVERLAESCRFPDCTHTAEPGCAVREALENGTLDAKRLRNYQQLKREAAYTEKREADRQRRQLAGRPGRKYNRKQKNREDERA